MSKVALMEFEGNPNVGLYMFVNDKFCLVGKELDKSKWWQLMTEWHGWRDKGPFQDEYKQSKC